MANTPTSMAAKLKQRYADRTAVLVPEVAEIQKRLEFRKDLMPGASAEIPVTLSSESGFSVGQGSVSLNGSVAQTVSRASVTPYSQILQVDVSYDLITRSMNDEQAFERFADKNFLGALTAFKSREEAHLLVGRSSIGKVESENGAGVLVISKQSWIPALFAGAIGTKLVAFDSLTGSTQHAGNLTITAVNISTRTVTVTSDATVADINANDYLFFKGQHNSGRIGLIDIAANTGSLYGIDAAAQPLWAGNAYDVGTSALTVGKILEASALAANKGCANEKLVCYVPPKTMQTLVADESALIRRDPNAKVMKSGAMGIEILSSTGSIEIVPHMYMPEGKALIYPPDYTYVIGSSECINQIGKGDDIFFDLESTSDKQMRFFSDTCGAFSERPGFFVLLTRSDSLALHE